MKRRKHEKEDHMKAALIGSGNISSAVANAEVPSQGPSGMSSRTVRHFFVLAFAIGWGLGAFMTVFSEEIEALFGEIGYTNPFFILIVWSPAMAGSYLVWRHFGWTGLRNYYRRATMWRMPAVWWAFLILGIPAIVYTGALFAGTATEFEFSPWYTVFGSLAITLAIGPIEEFGWRGLALPLLQRRHSPIVASLILGSLWGLWHVPAFLLSGTEQASWSFPAFFIGVLALAVIVTPMFNAARGSILMAALFHFQVNGPIWPDAQPWDTLVYAIAAIAIVYLNRETMFRKGAGATNVLMDESDEHVTVAKGPRAALHRWGDQQTIRGGQIERIGS
jgi:uncharacterized protein